MATKDQSSQQHESRKSEPKRLRASAGNHHPVLMMAGETKGETDDTEIEHIYDYLRRN